MLLQQLPVIANTGSQGEHACRTVVTYGSSPGMYTGNATGYGVVYNQYYNIPAKNNTPAALNYT